MPITITFDLNSRTTDGNDRTRIRLAFQRLGWETIGGTAYRYPPLNAQQAQQLPEDWFNHVVPALMYMRALIEKKRIQVENFTIDAHTSTAWHGSAGPRILDTQSMPLAVPPTEDAALSETRLRDWLKSVRDGV